MASQLGAPRSGATTRRQRQPYSRVNFEQPVGPDTEFNLALDRVRAGDLQLDFRPARQRTTLLANHADPMTTPRGRDSCRPTLGEPAALCRTQLNDEPSPVAGPSRLDTSKCAGRQPATKRLPCRAS